MAIDTRFLESVKHRLYEDDKLYFENDPVLYFKEESVNPPSRPNRLKREEYILLLEDI